MVADEITPNGYREIVVDSKTGQPRQAGASCPEGEFIKRFKLAAEQSLYVFGVGVIGRDYLTRTLHLPVCNFIQQNPPFRKMLLMPRGHAKTSIISHCLPPHMLIQPAETNIYFPGLKGTECRILLSGETATRAQSNLSVVKAVFEGNPLVKALWPEACWERPRLASREYPNVYWSNDKMTLPRETSYPDPSVYAIGVGGAITGSRPNVIIEDDLISREAANSDAVMHEAISWHRDARALLDKYEREDAMQSLTFVLGTRWAAFDLYEFIINGGEFDGKHHEPDYTIEYLIRKILEPGGNAAKYDTDEPLQPIWPERFGLEDVNQLRKDHGSMFHLLYMNEPFDPSLVDFDMTEVRDVDIKGDFIKFFEDERDETLRKRDDTAAQPVLPAIRERELPANAETFERLFGDGRSKYLRLKYT